MCKGLYGRRQRPRVSTRTQRGACPPLVFPALRGFTHSLFLKSVARLRRSLIKKNKTPKPLPAPPVPPRARSPLALLPRAGSAVRGQSRSGSSGAGGGPAPPRRAPAAPPRGLKRRRPPLPPPPLRECEPGRRAREAAAAEARGGHGGGAAAQSAPVGPARPASPRQARAHRRPPRPAARVARQHVRRRHRRRPGACPPPSGRSRGTSWRRGRAGPRGAAGPAGAVEPALPGTRREAAAEEPGARPAERVSERAGGRTRGRTGSGGRQPFRGRGSPQCRATVRARGLLSRLSGPRDAAWEKRVRRGIPAPGVV